MTIPRRLAWPGLFALLTTAVLLALALSATSVVRDAGASGPARASGAAAVDINHFAFHPGALHVGKGARVSFTNSSNTAHTATRAGSFDTGRIKPGRTVTISFTHRGTFAYHCSIHPFMKGKIVVE